MSDEPKRKKDEVYLTAREVSERYNGKLMINTLSNWRASKKKPKPGPVFIKAGGKVLYAESDLEIWENSSKSDFEQ